MADLCAAADRAIAAAVEQHTAGRSPEACFRQGVSDIREAMPPIFGPANAWLFNERDGKLDALQRALGLDDAAWCDAVRNPA